ncbi:MAG: lysoplasmalogenase [Anaerolineales bacterium]|nr:lysoplasmalogenase [Anaerolineales bacterium]
MNIFLLAALLIVAILDWIAVAKSIKRMEYIFKPGVMIVLLVFLYLATHFTGGIIWFALGICFSLLGDIFLMLPRKQFMTGLVFFLFAHIFYIGGFISFNPQFNWAGGLLVIAISFTSYRIFILVTSRKVYFVKKRLKIPVLFYTIAISAMLLFATLTLTNPFWFFLPAFMVSLGAYLFYISDSIIAVNRYVPGMHLSRIYSMMSYHCGQGLIIFGIVYQSELLISS